MTRFLVSDDNPGGRKLEEVLLALRAEVINRCTKISSDLRPESQHVMNNNMQVLHHLTEAIKLSQDSSVTLDRAFGPSEAAKGGPPRIGVV
ncbi:MAG: histidine kinase [Oceanicaulis sp.]